MGASGIVFSFISVEFFGDGAFHVFGPHEARSYTVPLQPIQHFHVTAMTRHFFVVVGFHGLIILSIRSIKYIVSIAKARTILHKITFFCYFE